MLLLRLVVPSETAATALAYLEGLEPVTDVVHSPGAARKPPGDFVQCVVATDAASSVVSALQELGIGLHGSITLDRLDATVSVAADRLEQRGGDAVVWEEVEDRAASMTALTTSFLVYMMAATVIAAVGILTDSVVLIIGAMVVGPEFGPLAGLCVGIIQRRGDLVRQALISLAAGFALAIAAAYAATWAFDVGGVAPGRLEASLHPATLFISRPDAYTYVIAALAGIAGMMSLTTASAGTLIGVLVSVTTIPAASNFGVALAYQNHDEATGSLVQLGANVVVLVLAGLLTLRLQRAAFARRVATFVERLRDLPLPGRPRSSRR
jgi:uncharacterized hydrophobic protein (TIGR00271 family)